MKQKHWLPYALMVLLLGLLSVMFLFQTGLGRSQMVQAHRSFFAHTTFEDQLKDSICQKQPDAPTPIDVQNMKDGWWKQAAAAASKETGATILTSLCDNSDLEYLCPLTNQCSKGSSEGVCKLNQICELDKTCAEYNERIQIAALDRKNQEIRDRRVEKCSDIDPYALCRECGDSREGERCSLIREQTEEEPHLCNFENYCAAGGSQPASRTVEPTKTLLNVRIKTKGVCPGSEFDGDDTTVRIELDQVANAGDVKEQLLSQINSKLISRFGTKCSFKVHDITKVYAEKIFDQINSEQS